MALIEERKNAKGDITYRVRVRLRGHPPETATFKRKTDAKEWITITEAAIKEGRYFKTQESKRRTVGELIDRYIEFALPESRADYQKIKMQLN